MDKKLNFLFANKQWKSLLLKVFFFGLGLLGLYFFNFSLFAVFLFGFLLLWFYFSRLPERGYSRISFLVLVLAAFFALRFFGTNFSVALGTVLIFSFLFYLLLGLTAFIFKNRHSVYLFLNTGLFLAVFMLFFSVAQSKYFLFLDFLLFLIIYFLIRECFNFPRFGIHNSLFIIPNPVFISLVIAFLSLELFWAISLLPIGFINSAILQTLFVFLMRDFALAYFSGRFNRRFLIYYFLAFIILVIFVFAASRWSI